MLLVGILSGSFGISYQRKSRNLGAYMLWERLLRDPQRGHLARRLRS